MPAAARAKPPAKPALRVVSLRVPLALAACGDPAERLALPERILIAKWGSHSALDGSMVIVDETTAATLSANQIKLGRVEIALDFEHGTFAETRQEPVKVAAYGTTDVEHGVGVWFVPTTWTPEGAEHYSGRHYRDVSPTVIRDEAGRVIALHSVALTRAGQLEGHHAFAASAEFSQSIQALSATTSSESPKAMDYKNILCKQLGLDPETATDEEITAKVTAAAALSAPPAKEEEKEKETPMALSADARMDAIERRQILDGAKAAGKIIPLSAEAANALPLATLQTLVDGLAAGAVPLHAQTPAADIAGGALKALSADEKNVCKLLGVDEKKFRELNP